MAESIPLALQQVLQYELARGERVVWYGQPAPSSRALASAGTFLFGIPFLGFALFWTWGATRGFNAQKHGTDSFGWFGYLWGGMFVFFGAAMVLSPLWAWWVARHTVYAVTDRRALLVERPLGRTTVQGFSGERLTDVIRREDWLGRGELIFERVVSKGSKGRTVYRDVGFFGLKDARAVANLLPTPAAFTHADIATRDV
ncbi:hypothetical protein J421_5361 (plasmid) [Gemmatirosa kalamazoonensis]|uniref:DUF304 domain-containing protein n=1 Tax=Gemmatirosa kalamazoonensis TaxID=861299 RepID=W0RQA3_9BACT|nr:PH domain-containing protein [Gemmatirosa kalamazoonensis]AHG92896.1 hypothetical protein J421_5361 [Gemmatirosa kalamazoonensis]